MYELGWNPVPLNEPNKEEDGADEEGSQAIKGSRKHYLLFSCGADGSILEFDPNKPNKPPKNINHYIENSRPSSTDERVSNTHDPGSEQSEINFFLYSRARWCFPSAVSSPGSEVVLWWRSATPMGNTRHCATHTGTNILKPSYALQSGR